MITIRKSGDGRNAKQLFHHSIAYYLVYALSLVILGVALQHWIRHFIDYPVYEFAAQRILKGEAFALYDLDRTSPGGFYYSYFFALCFVPFAYLGTFGKALFGITLLASYAYSLIASIRLSSKLVDTRILLCCILLSLYSLNDLLMTANIGVILLALSLAAFEYRDRNPILSGGLLSIAVVFKIYPLLVVCFFVWAKKWKVLLAFFLFTALTYLALPLLIHGRETGIALIQGQWQVLSHFNQHWSLTGDVFQNIPATFARWGLSYDVGLITGCLVLLLLCLKSFFRKDLSDTFIRNIFILVLAFVPLLTPVSWYNMGLFYLPLIAAQLNAAIIGQKKSAWWGLGLFAVLYCLTTPDLIGSQRSHALAAVGAPFLGVMALLTNWLVRIAGEK